MADETYDLIPTPEENPGELSPSALTDEPTGPIDYDLPCRHCGYNLRGLVEDEPARSAVQRWGGRCWAINCVSATLPGYGRWRKG